MKNKLELFVDKVNKYGGHAEIFKTQGKVKRIIAVFHLKSREFFVARLKYGSIVLSAVSYENDNQKCCLKGNYAIVDVSEPRIFEKVGDCFIGLFVKEKSVFYWKAKQIREKTIENIALDLGYYPIE